LRLLKIPAFALCYAKDCNVKVPYSKKLITRIISMLMTVNNINMTVFGCSLEYLRLEINVFPHPFHSICAGFKFQLLLAFNVMPRQYNPNWLENSTYAHTFCRSTLKPIKITKPLYIKTPRKQELKISCICCQFGI